MGIIIKQSIKGTIWTYGGVLVGFVTTLYLFPRYLTTDTIGLFGILIAYSILFSQFSALGFHGITNRLFPYFRDKGKKHNGFVFIAFTVMLFGFLLFAIVFHFIKPVLVENNIEKSELFADYINLLLPLTFFTLLFSQLDVYNKVLYNAVFGTFLQEFLQRILIFTITILFIFKILNLHQLVLFYVAVVCSKGIVLFLYLFIKGEISFRPQLVFIDRKLRNEMTSVALFSVLTGIGGNLILYVDKIIINQLLGLGQTGVYTIAFYFGTLVVIPSRPLLRISGTLIADAFKRNDILYISDIYKRSCLNQFLIGSFLFGGIWINIDNILEILPPDYVGAKWVIFFIGLGSLFDMLTGANGHIINFSKYYRVSLLFILVLIGFVVGSMYLLIPIYGITGAAISISISVFINNAMRFVFLKVKYKMQPFTWRILVILLVLVLAVFTVKLIPQLDLVYDLVIRSIVFTLIFSLLLLKNGISSEMNTTIKSMFKNIISIFK